MTSKRTEWIIVVVDSTIKKHSPTYKLARIVGADTAARWEKVARSMSRPALKRKAAMLGKEHPGW
jgi:hypothetical protein